VTARTSCGFWPTGVNAPSSGEAALDMIIETHTFPMKALRPDILLAAGMPSAHPLISCNTELQYGMQIALYKSG
jgi:hypothetical protein